MRPALPFLHRGSRPGIRIEILVPDFRGRVNQALDALSIAPPDVFIHSIETVPRLYRQARPGADYPGSLELLRIFGGRHPQVPTKSGFMVGLGETMKEVRAVMHDLRQSGCEMLTIWQYLAPSVSHLPVERYCTLEEFDALRVVW